MTVPVPGSLTYTYVEDGVSTVFSYPVRFLEATELLVIREAAGGSQSALVYNADYTVSGAGNPSGGSITRTAVTDGGKIIITRNTDSKQLVDLKDAQRNPAEAVELQLDRLAMAGQDMARDIGRSWKAGYGAEGKRIDAVPPGHFHRTDNDGNMVDAGLALPLPPGGIEGQYLYKDGDADGAATWRSTSPMPGGGDMLSSAYDPDGKGSRVGFVGSTNAWAETQTYSKDVILNGGGLAVGRANVPAGYLSYIQQVDKKTAQTTLPVTGTRSGSRQIQFSAAYTSNLAVGDKLFIVATGDIVKIASIASSTKVNTTTTLRGDFSGSEVRKVAYSWDGIVRPMMISRQLYAEDGTDSNSSGITMYVDMADGVKTDVYGFSFRADLANNYQSGGQGGQILGLSSIINRYGDNKGWPLYLEFGDHVEYAHNTDVKSAFCGEIKVIAIGPDHPTASDGNGYRKALTFIPSTQPGYTGAEIGAAILISNPSSSDDAAYWRYGIHVTDTAGASAISTGMRIATRGAFGLALEGSNSEAQLRIMGLSAATIVSAGAKVNSGELSSYRFRGLKSNGNEGYYARLRGLIVDDTNGAHAGRLILDTVVAGSNKVQLDMAAGVNVGDPAGQHQGNGTLNTEGAIYRNGIKVLDSRSTGWAAMTGAGSKAALAASAAGTASAAYTQSELQTALNRIAALEARLKAYDDMLVGHGLIGP